MKEIFKFDKSHLSDDTSGVELDFMDFLDKASKMLMKSKTKIHKDSRWNIPTGVAFRLEVPSEIGYIKIPKPNRIGRNRFSPIKTVARELSQYFSLEIDDVEAYTRELRDVYNAEHKDSGYEAGGLGYESIAGSSQDFARFVNILLERGLIPGEKLRGAKIYAKPNGSHALAKLQKIGRDSESGGVSRYKFSELNSKNIKESIPEAVEKSGFKKIFITIDGFDNIEYSGKEQIQILLREIIENYLNYTLEERGKILKETGIRPKGKGSGSGSGSEGARNQLAYLNKFINYVSGDSDLKINLEESYLELYMKNMDDATDVGVNESLEKVFNSLEKNKNVIVEGVAGSGKSHLLESLRRTYYKQEGNSGANYWVAPEKSEKDSEEKIKRKESEGFSPLYGESCSQLEVVVFHPSTSYEEFVSGIRPNFTKKEGEGEFVTQEGTFVQMCNRAAANPDKKFLLFIDEINRANTSRVFGDLMLVIEDSKRVDFSKFTTKSPEDENFETENKPKVNSLGADESADGQVAKSEKYPLKDYQYGALFSSETTIPSTEDGKSAEYVRLQTPIIKQGIEFSKLAVPSNLHVMGTMNTTDRSVGTIDLALRRRFHWITQEPMSDKKELIDALELSGDKDKSVDLVAGWFMDANTVLKTEVGPDARLGHAYFFGKDGDAKAIAEALITQLLEIIYTFNIKEDVLEKIGLPKLKAYNDKKLDYEGKGLGRRPIVKEDKGKSPTADGGSDSENEVSDNTDSENSQGDQ